MPIPSGLSNSPPNSFPGNINPITQIYIDEANAEIAAIMASNPELAAQLNTVWNAIGTQLKREQRARSIGFYALPEPKDPFEPLCLYPTMQYSFVDNLGIYGANTLPHMYSQTIEAIVDWGTVGGRSTVGVMREQRNQARLTEIGVALDNNIVGHLDQTINNAVTKSLISNGNLDTVDVSITNGNQTATLATGNGGTNPVGYYDPVTDDYVVTNPDYITNLDNFESPTTLQTGGPMVPGSLGGSPYTNLIPPELNAAYISGQLTPGTYTVKEAIQEVIDCNCDCWEEP